MAHSPTKYIRVKHSNDAAILIKANAPSDINKAISVAAPFLTINHMLLFDACIFQDTDWNRLPCDCIGELTLVEVADLPYHSLLCLLEAVQESAGQSDLQYYDKYIANFISCIQACTEDLFRKIMSYDPFANRYILEDEVHTAIVCPIIIRCIVGLLADCGVSDEEVQKMVPTSLCHVQPTRDGIMSCVVHATANICDKYLELTHSEVAKIQHSMGTRIMDIAQNWIAESGASKREVEKGAFLAFMRNLSETPQVEHGEESDADAYASDDDMEWTWADQIPVAQLLRMR